ncbi:Alstrom syndrome protein 1 [Manis javanica]|nr:Alstrom syndrome protein 1 [Manis javanica]
MNLISRATIPRIPGALVLEAGDVAVWNNQSTQHYALNDYYPAPRRMGARALVGDIPRGPADSSTHLPPSTGASHEFSRWPPFPRKPAAPDHHGGPLCAWLAARRFPRRHSVTMDEQIQKAWTATTPAPPCCTCMRELDGKGSKRLSKFSELIAGVRARVPR